MSRNCWCRTCSDVQIRLKSSVLKLLVLGVFHEPPLETTIRSLHVGHDARLKSGHDLAALRSKQRLKAQALYGTCLVCSCTHRRTGPHLLEDLPLLDHFNTVVIRYLYIYIYVYMYKLLYGILIIWEWAVLLIGRRDCCRSLYSPKLYKGCTWQA